MPTTPINKPDPGNMGFLRALLAAIIFMILSAAILISGFLAWHYPQLIAGSNIKPITLTGNELYIAIGKGEKQDSKLIVNELIEDGTAVISSRRTRFNASNYPVLEYKITGRSPGTDVVLYWRTITHNHQTLFAKLHWNSDYKGAYKLQNHQEWKGKITELGISIAGDLRNEPISIEQLTFSPLTVKSLLLTVWSEWNAFQGWTQSSINVIKGMPANALVSPVVAAAAWCGLAILMYSLKIIRTSIARRDVLLSVDRDHPDNSTWKVTKRIWDFRAVVAMFLIAWLALDGKWQVNLWRQLADTQYLFAGKSHHEQHMAAEDAELYAYAKRLKEKILPVRPVRIFIVQQKFGRRERLRMLYHLLPHDVTSMGGFSNKLKFRHGDFLLVLNPQKKLQYSEKKQLLSWRRGRALNASHIDHDPLGDLFQVSQTNLNLAKISLTSNWRNVSSGRLIHRPVYISGPVSFRGGDPGAVRFRTGPKGNKEARFQEWDVNDDRHSREHASLITMASGVHQMKDGSIWEVGTFNSSRGNEWHTHMFSAAFPGTPKLFLTIQTSPDTDAATLRANNLGPQGFDAAVFEQELSTNSHQPKTIGYLAIYSPSNQGAVLIDGESKAYELSQVSVDNKWVEYDQYKLLLQEEQSKDDERSHLPEIVDVLIIDGHLFSQPVSFNEKDTISVRYSPLTPTQ